MKGKNKVMKTKTKSLNDVYKKIIACVILVAMFSVYVLPIKDVFGALSVYIYYGEYFTLESDSKNVLEQILTDIQWRTYRNRSTFIFDKDTGEIIWDGSICKVKLPRDCLRYASDNAGSTIKLQGISIPGSSAMPDFRMLSHIKDLFFLQDDIYLGALEQGYNNGYFYNINQISIKMSTVYAKDVEELLKSGIWKSGKIKTEFNVRFNDGSTMSSRDVANLNKKPSTPAKKIEDDKVIDDTAPKNLSGSLEAALNAINCPSEYIQDLQNGNYSRFNNWWNGNDYYKPNFDAIDQSTGQWLVNELGRITGGFYTITWAAPVIYQDPVIIPGVTRTVHLSYKYSNHTFHLEGHTDAVNDFGETWTEDANLQIIEPDGTYLPYKVNSGDWKVSKNGTYILLSNPPGLSEPVCRMEFTVNDIDNDAPIIKSVQKMAPTTNARGMAMKINVHDDGSGLKSVYVESVKNKSKNWTINLNGEKDANVEQTVPESGDYKIVVEDKGGNKSEERIENVTVDTTQPKPVGNPKVTVVGKENAETHDGMPIVKEGDTVQISILSDKKIKSIGNPNYGPGSYGAVHLKEGKNSVLYKGELQKIDSNMIDVEIPITRDIIEEYGYTGKAGGLGIELFYVRDEYNNQGDVYSEDGSNQTSYFSFDDLFYIDDKAPTLTKSEIAIRGTGRKYTNSSKENYMLVESGAKYAITLTFDEELGSNPTLKIGNSESTVEAKYSNNNKNGYNYVAEIDCDKLIKEGKLQKNSDVPITITNIVDKIGFKGKDIVIDKNNKFSNKFSLNYGVVDTELLYIAAATNGTEDEDEDEDEKIEIGDINADGLVNAYDKMILERSLAKLETLTEDEVKRADLDYNNQITTSDGFLMQEMVDKTINKIYNGVEKTLKVYDSDNLQLKGRKLNWEITDYEGNEIKNGEETTINISETDGTVKIKLSNIGVCPITIKAILDDGSKEDERIVGKLVLDDGFDTDGAVMRITNKEGKGNLVGDINNDGYVTGYDSTIALRASVNLEKLTAEERKNADVNGDGKVDSADALMILRMELGLERGFNDNVRNTIKKGDSVVLEILKTEGVKQFSEIKKDNPNATVEWSLITNYDNAFELVESKNTGTAELKVKDGSEAVEGAVAIVKGTIKVPDETSETGVREYVSTISWQIAEPAIEVEKDTIQMSLEDTEKSVNLYASSSVDNEEIRYKSSNTNVADVEVDDFGNVKVLAKESGESIIVVETDDAKKEVKVNVTKAIESIEVDKTELTVGQGAEADLKVTINPSNATEDLRIVSSDTNVATIRYDETSKVYKVKGVAGGNAQIRVYSDNNQEITKTVNITVNKIDLPTITKIVVENNEEGKVYKAGDEIFLRVNFDGAVAGTAPELKIKFGERQSVNKTEFVEGLENDTVLRYKYTVAEGDNGQLMAEKLSGGLLTDTTKQVQVNTSQDNDIYNSTEGDTKENTYINDGLYKTIDGVTADTENPSVKIITNVDKDTNWLKNGDEIKVQVISEEDLKDVPTVLFNNKEAKVEGEGSVFTASLPVTSELTDGYLEIKVDNMVDTAGNTREAVVVKEDNINEPIIIDNSAPTIASVNIRKAEGKEYAAGEKFDIIVNFKDAANVTKEYITASEIPGINLKFGGKAAQGTITSDYEVGNYVEQIKYTYTVAQGDKGEVTVDSMSGTITDVAGNTNDLSKVKIVSEVKETPVSSNSSNNNVTYNNVKSPKTGDESTRYVCILLAVGMVIMVVEYCYRKNKRDK